MATNKRAKAVCDISGFVYPRKVMRLNSYGLLVGPLDYDGQYDFKNHPQNRVPDVREDPTIKNARPDNTGRNAVWNETEITWNDDSTDTVRKWNTI